MAADSITTQMLKDNSVTSDKIDWATTTVDFRSRATAGVSIGNSQFIAIGNLRIMSVQTNPHTITNGETVLTLDDLSDLPPQSIVFPGVIQSGGESCTMVLYGANASQNKGVVEMYKASTLPSTDNRLAFTLVWSV